MEQFLGGLFALLVLALIVISACMRRTNARITYLETRERTLANYIRDIRFAKDRLGPSVDRSAKTLTGLLEHFHLTAEVVPSAPERIEIRKVME